MYAGIQTVAKCACPTKSRKKAWRWPSIAWTGGRASTSVAMTFGRCVVCGDFSTWKNPLYKSNTTGTNVPPLVLEYHHWYQCTSTGTGVPPLVLANQKRYQWYLVTNASPGLASVLPVFHTPSQPAGVYEAPEFQE